MTTKLRFSRPLFSYREYRRSFAIRAAILAACLLFCRNAIAAEVACPAQIEVRESLAESLNSWKSFIFPGTKRDLTDVEFRQSGDKGGLHYDDEDTHAGLTVYSYWFPDRKALYQVICAYADTHVALVRNLNQDIRKCNVTFAETSSGAPVFKKAECF